MFHISSREEFKPSLMNIFSPVIILHDGDDVTLITLLIAQSLAFRCAETLPPAHQCHTLHISRLVKSRLFRHHGVTFAHHTSRIWDLCGTLRVVGHVTSIIHFTLAEHRHNEMHWKWISPSLPPFSYFYWLYFMILWPHDHKIAMQIFQLIHF